MKRFGRPTVPKVRLKEAGKIEKITIVYTRHRAEATENSLKTVLITESQPETLSNSVQEKRKKRKKI